MTKLEYVQLISDLIDGQKTFPGFDEAKGLCCYGCKHNNRACFIGVLIPKDHPLKNTSMALREVVSYPEGYDFKDYFPDGATLEQMELCQGIHDQRKSYSPEDFLSEKERILSILKSALNI